MPTRSTAFSSFDVQPRSGEGINGSLTPARQPRQNTKSTNDIPIYAYDASNENPSRHARQGDRGSAGLSAHVGEVVGGKGMPSGLRQGSRSSDPLSGCAAGNGGINLQATEAKIDQLERGEFDLKLKLFYMEEQLELAAGGTDVLQLHKEVMEAKLVSALRPLASRRAIVSCLVPPLGDGAESFRCGGKGNGKGKGRSSRHCSCGVVAKAKGTGL